MSNIENLKKRAKTLVKHHRLRHFPVATRIRRSLPHFADLPDHAILDAPFALFDALEVVAREAGFDTWVLAQKELKRMPEPKKERAAVEAPRLVVAHPQVLVSDVTRAAKFYVEKLGFKIVFLYGEPPFYGLVARDGACLNLRHVCDPTRYQAHDETDVLAASIPTEGVKALFLEYKGRRVPFAQTLKEQSWGGFDFLVRDPDGNLICFGEAT